MKKETFSCAGCGEEFDSIFDFDDTNYEGALGCGTCGEKYCGDCEANMVGRGDGVYSICINCTPESFVSSITIGTADEARLVGSHVRLADEEFQAVLDHYENSLQTKFEFANIEFDQNEHKDSFSLNANIADKIGCNLDDSIERMITACWEDAIGSFEREGDQIITATGGAEMNQGAAP